MKGVYLDARFDCIICFQRQVMRAVSYINADENVKESILREVMKRLLELDWSLKPIEIANEVHKIVRTITKVKDPYEKIKKDSNNLVLKLYPKLVSIVEQSADCLKAAIKLAIAGNIMDFGAFNDFNLHETINEVLRKQFLFDDYEIFKVKLKDAKSLLFFSDNSGEIGFDKLLIKNMLKEKFFKKIAFVVKGGPFMNDATLEDALYLGLNEFPNIEFLTISCFSESVIKSISLSLPTIS